MGKLIGYARVSTLEQNAALQHDALTAAGCWRVFTDRVSGVTEDRPELGRALEQLRDGDTLVVWRLDRLGRSLRHLIDVVTGLAGDGVGFRSGLRARDRHLSDGQRAALHQLCHATAPLDAGAARVLYAVAHPRGTLTEGDAPRPGHRRRPPAARNHPPPSPRRLPRAHRRRPVLPRAEAARPGRSALTLVAPPLSS